MQKMIKFQTVYGAVVLIRIEEIEGIEYFEDDDEGIRTTINMKSGKSYTTEALASEVIEALQVNVKALD